LLRRWCGFVAEHELGTRRRQARSKNGLKLSSYNGIVCSKVLTLGRRNRLLRSAVGAAVGLTWACSNPVAPPPPPPVVVNTPPTIQSLQSASLRIEANQEAQLTAVVRDEETPLNELTYTWSSSPPDGTFTSNRATASWRAPAMAVTPQLYTLTLTVSETYTSAGVQKQNSVSSSVQVHYNDSVPEITNLVLEFLADFSTYSVTPEECVRNFSDSCRGKWDELRDVEQNRELFEIQGGVFSVSSVTLNGDKTRADVVAPCTFFDIVKATGVRETVVGTCLLTAVYESWRWLLCESRFNWSSTTTTSERLRLRYGHP